MVRRERESRGRRYIGIGICIALGIAIGLYHNRAVRRGKPDVVVATVRTVSSPVVNVFATPTRWLSRQVGWLFHGRTLSNENARLKAENARLNEELGKLREADITAKRLQQQLGFSPPPGYEKMAADILSLRPDPHFDTMVIARGSRDGVKLHSVVVSPYGLVGQVFDVAPTTSSVLLLTDSNSAAGAMVQRPESRAAGVCKGNGSPLLSLVYLDRSADIKAGDTIITSGLAGDKGVFPKGLVIGTVVNVGDKATGATRNVKIKPAVNLDRLEEVYVLR